MINPNTRQRWQSIAEELGLPFEPAAAGAQEELPAEAPAAAATPSAELLTAEQSIAPPEPAEETPSGRGQRRRGRDATEETPPPEATVRETVSAEPAAEPAPTLQAGDAEPAEQLGAPVAEAAEEAPSREEGRSRGRRRRRGRGAGREEAAEVVEVEPADGEAAAESAAVETPAAEEVAGEEGAEERKRRRRGRGRKRHERDATDREEDPAEEIKAEEAPAEEEEEDDGGEIDDLSNWNAPSWNDLIDSLYRPDR